MVVRKSVNGTVKYQCSRDSIEVFSLIYMCNILSQMSTKIHTHSHTTNSTNTLSDTDVLNPFYSSSTLTVLNWT